MGEVSFGVHLVHMLFVTVTTAFIPADAWGVRWLVVTVFTLEFLAAVKRLGRVLRRDGWASDEVL